jgi:hypothetical protein
MFKGTKIYPCFFLCELSQKDTGIVCVLLSSLQGAGVMIINSYISHSPQECVR